MSEILAQLGDYKTRHLDAYNLGQVVEGHYLSLIQGLTKRSDNFDGVWRY